MRAVAVGAVLLCHAGVPFARGGFVGVDVFFVISGFLITGFLLRELERSDTISLAKFYARRVRRLLPLATLVLVVIVILSAALLSPVRNELVAGDVVAAAAYVVNWRFAAQAVDYFGSDVAASPVQHYWTLAVEEQFYLLWPGLLLAATWWWRRSGREILPVVWVLVLVVLGGSFAYNLWYTQQVPEAAYFSSLTRAWELALGAAIALVRIPRLSATSASLLGFAGVAAIGIAVVALDGQTTFPGTAALLPTVGTAALIVAGASNARNLPARGLSVRPARYVGRISYSWYLWHWPALIFAAEIWGRLSVSAGLLVVAASFIPTAVSHRWIERPLHHSRALVSFPRRALALWSAGTGVTVAAALVLLLTTPSLPTAPEDEVLGAAALEQDPSIQRTATALRPNPRDAAEDVSRLANSECFLSEEETDPGECVFGNPSSDVTVVLFGDSHAVHFFPALERLARSHDWRLVTLVKRNCTPAEVRINNSYLQREYTECEQWRQEALRRIEEERPQLTLVGNASRHRPLQGDTMLQGEDARDEMSAGLATTLSRIREAGLSVALLKDPPRPPHDIPGCVSEALDELDTCAFPPAPFEEHSLDDRAVEAVDGARLIDTTGSICPDGLCRAVIGDVIVYGQGGHLTATFAATLAPVIDSQLPRLR